MAEPASSRAGGAAPVSPVMVPAPLHSGPHPLTHSLTHSLIHPLVCSLTCSLQHPAHAWGVKGCQFLCFVLSRCPQGSWVVSAVPHLVPCAIRELGQ